jgi:molybdopterin/thiamine biosynthesis adenylyltransferase
MYDDNVKPLLKHSSVIHPFPGVVYLDNSGVAVEIADPDGSVHALLTLLDGTRTAPEIHRDLVRDHPAVTAGEVAAAIEQFDEAGFLLDGRHTADGILSDYEFGRWERNVNFFGSYSRMSDNRYATQRKLTDLRVTLLGLGGLGSHLLLDLAAIGVGHIRIVDFDKVELSNLNRQILYNEADVGKPKIECAERRVREFSSHLDLETMECRLSGADDVYKAAEGADILLSSADRPKAEIMSWVNEGIVRRNIPMITGGLDTQRCLYYSVIPGVTGCIECWRRQVRRDDPVSDRMLSRRRSENVAGDKGAFVPMVVLVTGFVISELVRIVTGIAPPMSAGKLTHGRFSDYDMTIAESWDRDPDCPVCGGVTEPPRLLRSTRSYVGV